MPQEFLPLLKPENIDQLKSLILEIMEENDSKLEKIIENRQNKALQSGECFTIEDLNDILSDQCLQKQKIISNLSHFACTSIFNSVSLMNTIDVLWQDNEDLEYQIKDQREVIEQINNHLLQIGKESDLLRNKLQMTYHDLHQIQEEKQAVEEYLSSIIVKHDSSFCLKEQRKLRENNFEEERNDNQGENHHGQDMYFTEDNFIVDGPNEKDKIQPLQQTQEREQNFETSFDKQNRRNSANCKSTEIDLLQESIIKDSISVIRRFTLTDSAGENLPILEESHEDITFISKSNRFSLVNEISLQIFDENNQKDLPSTTQSLARVSDMERSIIRDLKISNEKINITIATGTEFTQTRESQKNRQEQFSMIQPSPSCSSFMLNRQNSAVMYPSLERSISTISFVTHTTKQIQTDPHPPKPKDIKQKNNKNIQKKSIGIETSTFSQTKKTETSFFNTQNSQLDQSQSQSNVENTSRKSFGQLLDYFTKKIVSDRIKTGNKKNDFGAFKKTKSNIQKVF